MLTRLIISNLAIIENVDIHFQDGFTILTGSTGAGKSLIIDSLSLLLGARASVELIRTGEDKATIKGYFNINNKRLNAILTNLDIPFINDNKNELLSIVSNHDASKYEEPEWSAYLHHFYQ